MIPLLALLCWAPVTLDCLGGPESPVTYRDEVAHLTVIGEQACSGDPADGMCPMYQLGAFGVVDASADPCVPDDGWSPSLGEILLIRSTTIDAAGNEDCGA